MNCLTTKEKEQCFYYYYFYIIFAMHVNCNSTNISTILKARLLCCVLIHSKTQNKQAIAATLMGIHYTLHGYNFVKPCVSKM